MKNIYLLIFLMIFSLGQSQTPATGPASPPARNAWDVLSQYGNTYSNQPGVVFADFGGSVINGDVTLGDGSVVKQYSNHSYSGISVNGAMSLDVSSMTHVHFDVWSPNFTSMRFKLEGTNTSFNEIDVPGGVVQGQWNSIDIPLTSFPNTTLNALRWLVPVTFGQNATLYITNVYFYRPATEQPPVLGTFTVPAKNVGDPAFTLTAPTSTSPGAFTFTSSNTNVATISGSTVTIVGGGTSLITANQAAVPGQFGPASTSANLVVSYPTPGPSPTPPARDPGSVISMYTGNPPVYANPVGFNMVRAPWTGGTTSDFNFPNGSDTCIKLDNFGFFGYVTDTEPVRFSVAGTTKLHVDIYLNTPIANMFVFLLANGDHLYNTGPLVTGWNSLDITLATAYPGANLDQIYGFKFEHNQGAARQIYLDNIYFYTGGTEPTITDFTVPEKVFGEAPFALTPPNSNSPGAFSYQSSNTSVATITGSTVTLVGPGTSTITAIQAASGSFDSGSITAQLVVTAPPLSTAAPTPPARNAWDVISYYSDAYDNPFTPTWGGQTEEVFLEGNSTRYFNNFLFGQIAFAPVNISEMTHFHIDIYSVDQTPLWIWLNNQRVIVPTPTNGWTSLDIPLSDFAGLNTSAVNIVKIENPNGAAILRNAYVDNIYFYRPETLLPPTLGEFTVPVKQVGDPDFTLIPPTSNSSGTFSYTSSNTSVATISGDTVTIVGGGTTIITATQASEGIYGPRSVSANLLVSFGPPGPSPIPPVRAPQNVVSMYTGTPSAYADAITMVRAPWSNGATSMTEVPNGTNTCLRVDNLGFIGLVTNGPNFSVEGMTNLHMDIYLNAPINSNPALSRFFIFLLAPGDQFYEVANLVAGWNSIDIDLSSYPGADLSNIYGLKIEQNSSQTGAVQFYIDNIYFNNNCITYYADADGDGYGSDTDIIELCNGEEQPNGYITVGGDCNDDDDTIYPGAVEICYDGILQNCNGDLNDGCPVVLARLRNDNCGSTLSTINEVLRGDLVSPSVPVGVSRTGYRFRLTNTTTNAVREVERPNYVFQISTTDIAEYATVYTVEVAVRLNEQWMPYGPACTVVTPGVPSTVIAASSCGTTLAQLNNIIRAEVVPSAVNYEYEVSLIEGGVAVETTTLVRPGASFNLLQLTGISIKYGAEYRIRVKVEVPTATGLQWSANYGAACSVFSPLAPESQIEGCGTEEGIAPATLNTVVYATPVGGATQYRFTLSDGMGYSQVYTSSTRTFRLSNFNALSPLTPGGIYSVSVETLVYGSYYAGKDCNILVPGGGLLIRPTEITKEETVKTLPTEFKAIAYPNPFAISFGLDVRTSGTEKISLAVYDMAGRLLEAREVAVTEMTNYQFGDRYPSGVYNVIVTQGEETRTVRVVKN